MSLSRLAAVVVLLLSACASACAAWDTSTPNRVPPPPVEGPAPSQDTPPPVEPGYAPPPPVDPRRPGSVGAADRVVISSVQLLENCPDPPEAEVAADMDRGITHEEQQRKGGAPRCEQSTVQLAVRSDRAGQLRIEAVRILDGARQRFAGSSTLRQPTLWSAADSRYTRWDERVTAGKDLQISYKLGILDLSRAEPLSGPDFNAYSGPFMLELEVSIDGRRQTVRSTAFVWQRMDMVET